MELFGIQFQKKTDFSGCLIGPCLKAYLDIPRLTRYVKIDKHDMIRQAHHAQNSLIIYSISLSSLSR